MDASAGEECVKSREKIQRRLRDYYQFLTTTEHMHRPIVYYQLRFPGLVHFIAVNRTTQKVIAPSIMPAHGRLYPCNEDQSHQMVQILRRRVVDLYHQSQEMFWEGNSSMVMKFDDFTYSYRLSLVDHKGRMDVVPQVQKVVSSYRESGEKESLWDSKGQIYTDIIKKSIPNPNPKQVVCAIEVYVLYIGAISSRTVAVYDSKLFEAIKTENSSFFPEPQ